jgi:hypothetical protein
MKNVVFWYMTTPCCSSTNRRFGGTYRLHLQGERLWVPLVCCEDLSHGGWGGEPVATASPMSCFVLVLLLLQMWWLVSGLVSYISTVHIDTTVEIPLQEAHFLLLRDVHPRCKPRGIRVFRTEDGSNMFLLHAHYSSWSHTASSYTLWKHSVLQVGICLIFIPDTSYNFMNVPATTDQSPSIGSIVPRSYSISHISVWLKQFEMESSSTV